MEISVSQRFTTLWSAVLVVGVLGACLPVTEAGALLWSDTEGAMGLAVLAFVATAICVLLILLGARGWQLAAVAAAVAALGLLAVVMQAGSESESDTFGPGAHLLVWFFGLSAVVGIAHAVQYYRNVVLEPIPAPRAPGEIGA